MIEIELIIGKVGRVFVEQKSIRDNLATKENIHRHNGSSFL